MGLRARPKKAEDDDEHEDELSLLVRVAPTRHQSVPAR